MFFAHLISLSITLVQNSLMHILWEETKKGGRERGNEGSRKGGREEGRKRWKDPSIGGMDPNLTMHFFFVFFFFTHQVALR